jgi:hypothetical protein
VAHRTHNLQALLEALFQLEFLPNELWAVKVVVRALRHPDPELRELAVAVAATGEHRVWAQVLFAFVHRETEPYLSRFARLVLDEHRTLSVAL